MTRPRGARSKRYNPRLVGTARAIRQKVVKTCATRSGPRGGLQNVDTLACGHVVSRAGPPMKTRNCTRCYADKYWSHV